MRSTILVMVATACAVPHVFGQSLNIDYGNAAGSPPADYAAAGLPGVWNALTAGSGVTQHLVGLNGDGVVATVVHSHVSPVAVADPGTSGPDEALLDDGLPGLGDVAFTIQFQGLISGLYEVTTYAWTPANPEDATLVIVDDSYGGGLVAGGPWPGGLQEGITHVVHEVEVSEGTLTMIVVGGYWGATGFLNGIQLRRVLSDGSMCSLPPAVGPCDGVCPRYFYDVCTGQCELFNYGCCGGNANNFLTREECAASCPPEDDICFLPADPGPCDGICPRFFHNICAGQCESFIYGCCGGNANNFKTLAQCQAACGSVPCHPADLDGDGAVRVPDLLLLLGAWGPNPGHPADFDGDGEVRVPDLLFLLEAWGPCAGQVCGTIAGIVCENDHEFCLFRPGRCQVADDDGLCMPIPEACTEIWDPVCGCDGVTYSNECFAHQAEMSIDHAGPCENACGGILGIPCTDPADFCKLGVGQCCCGFQGVCTPTPEACRAVWDPVCGCDGVTYGNECEAAAAGVNINHLGSCEVVCEPSPDGVCCVPLGCSPIPEDQCIPTALHLDVSSGALTTLACECIDFNLCHIEFGDASPFAVGNCPVGSECVVVGVDTDGDGIEDTFTAECAGASPGVCCLDIDDGPVSYDTCVEADEDACFDQGGIFGEQNASCADAQACCLGFAGSTFCADLHPWCCVFSGGVPQGSGSTCADVNGGGGCGQLCGGVAGFPCDNPDDFCKTPVGFCCCDFLGTCTPVPSGCADVWDPVCGCDGMTYSNECFAHAARMSVDHEGPC